MARQPFLPKYRGTPTSMGAEIIEGVPKLAEFVGRIAVNWTGVELHLSLALGSLLGVQSAASVAVFLSLRNHRAQRDALAAAARRTLGANELAAFEAILALHSELDKQRNDLIHGVFGIATATSDGIIWCSVQDHATMLLNDYYLSQTGQLSAQERPDQILKGCFVLSYKDLAGLNKSIIQLAHAARNFHAFLRYKGSVVGDNAWSDLINEPLIQRMMIRQSSAVLSP